MRVAIGLGSSLGDRAGHVELAIRRLDAAAGMSLERASLGVRTPPMRGGTARGWFLNAVAVYETERTPQEILELCISLEHAANRRRARHWGDRTLDLDVLHVEGVISADPVLLLPHPAIGKRRFVLGPLLSIWPDATHPGTGIRWADGAPPAGPRPVPVMAFAVGPKAAYQGRSTTAWNRHEAVHRHRKHRAHP